MLAEFTDVRLQRCATVAPFERGSRRMTAPRGALLGREVFAADRALGERAFSRDRSWKLDAFDHLAGCERVVGGAVGAVTQHIADRQPAPSVGDDRRLIGQ